MLALVALQLTTIFFTQSRGPWLGLGAALFVFFTLLLWRAYGRARAAGSPRAGLLRGLLAGEIGLALVLGAFLVAFNLSSAPVFQQLRSVPYIGRMGTLLETDSGTGLVRRLIWSGDDKAGGAIGLITSDPLRAVIGWGPESMFVAYNKFYPPALANIEARVLVPMANDLKAKVAKGGLLVLSGILLPQEDEVVAAYAPFQVVSAPKKGEWVAIVLRAP